MKICLYSPYIPKHFGGGEKYLLDCASLLSQNHEVSIALNSAGEETTVKASYESFFGLDLSQVKFIQTPLGTSASFIKKLLWTQQWDVLYYLTDGSLFFSLAKKNILHIQFPFTFTKPQPLERLKLANWQLKNTNSHFTKKVIEQSWHTKIELVHWPLIEVNQKLASPVFSKKEKIILNVGRFFRQLHSKRQDIMVEMFRELCSQNPEFEKWKLVFIGGVEDQDFFNEVKALAKGLRVEFYTELDRSALESWYQRTSIYWHATGYDIDELKEPEKVEHFGISTVEAMSYGCVPVVIGKGGQKEILEGELRELLWQTKEECVAKTSQIIKDTTQRDKYSQLALARATLFGSQRFATQLNTMIE